MPAPSESLTEVQVRFYELLPENHPGYKEHPYGEKLLRIETTHVLSARRGFMKLPLQELVKKALAEGQEIRIRPIKHKGG